MFSLQSCKKIVCSFIPILFGRKLCRDAFARHRPVGMAKNTGSPGGGNRKKGRPLQLEAQRHLSARHNGASGHDGSRMYGAERAYSAPDRETPRILQRGRVGAVRVIVLAA